MEANSTPTGRWSPHAAARVYCHSEIVGPRIFESEELSKGSVRTQRSALFLALKLASDVSVLRTKASIFTAEFGSDLTLCAEF